MNRKPVALALVAFLVVVVALPAAPVAAQEPEGTVYLALGDSLAWGYGATDRLENAYVPHFYGFLHGDSHSRARELVNLSVGGETSTSFRAAGGQLDQAVAAILDPDTDISVVTLDIGGNDLLDLLKPGEVCAAYPPTPECIDAAETAIGVFAVNYGQILGTLGWALAQDPGSETLMVMTYYNPWSGTGSAYEAVVNMLLLGAEEATNCAAPMDTWGLNDFISCIGTGASAKVVDVYPRFDGMGLEWTHIAEGDIHPNDSGYAQIYTVFRTAYLNQ